MRGQAPTSSRLVAALILTGLALVSCTAGCNPTAEAEGDAGTARVRVAIVPPGRKLRIPA